jgi:hypothetical protein
MRTGGILSTLFVVLAAVSAASADTIQIAYVGVDAGGYEGVILNGVSQNGPNGVQKFNTQNAVGSLAEQISPQVWGYCYELGQFTDSSYNTYNVVTVDSAMGSTVKADLMRQLWAQHYDDSWQADTFIYVSGFVSGQPANTPENIAALAFDFAMYEINYDFNGTLSSLNLDADTFKANQGATNPAAAVDMARDWLAGLVMPENYSGPLANLLALSSCTKQDLIVEVPEPASVSLLLLGGLALVRRRRTRM